MQAITAVGTASDLSGYFFVGFEGHWSEKIAYDASSDDVASALSGIPAIGQVNVSSSMLCTTRSETISTERKFGRFMRHVPTVLPCIRVLFMGIWAHTSSGLFVICSWLGIRLKMVPARVPPTHSRDIANFMQLLMFAGGCRPCTHCVDRTRRILLRIQLYLSTAYTSALFMLDCSRFTTRCSSLSGGQSGSSQSS